MCIVMFLLCFQLDSHSFCLLFMFLLLHILSWCEASAYWNGIFPYSSNFFPLHIFPPLGPAEKNSVYRHSPNHLTFLPHLLKHDCYYPSALCFVSTLKLDWWEHAWGTERQLFLLCSVHGDFFQKLLLRRCELVAF